MRRIALVALAAAAMAPSCTFAQSAPVSNKTGSYASAGAAQMGLSVGGTAVALTVPAGSTSAEICVESNAIRYRDDGTAPTASVGMPVLVSTCFPYAGPLTAIQLIAQTGTASVSVSYYK